MQHDVALPFGERLVRDVEANPELARRVHRQPPPAGVPWQTAPPHSPRTGGFIDLRSHAQALAGRARSVRVEGEGLGPGMLEVRTADRADDLLGERRDRRADAVAVRAQVRAEPRHHQPKHVQDLRHGPDGAARPGDRRPLTQGKRGREVVDPVHVRALCLGQPTAAVRAQAGEVPLHAFGVQGAEGERRLARPGHADQVRHNGTSTSTSRKLLCRAPCTLIARGKIPGAKSSRAVMGKTYAGRRCRAPAASDRWPPGAQRRGGGQG